MTDETPGMLETADVTRVVSSSRMGQAETVSSTSTMTTPPGWTSKPRTMPISVIGRLISGSWTVARAA